MQTGLPQAQADALLQMEKFRVDDTRHEFPQFGGNIQIALQSVNRRESFALDIGRRRIALTTKYQTRARQSLVLARLDFNAPHRNPDGAEIGVPHLHLYREGFADKWAYAVAADFLKNPADEWQVLHDFMDYCRIVAPPIIDMGLFS